MLLLLRQKLLLELLPGLLKAEAAAGVVVKLVLEILLLIEGLLPTLTAPIAHEMRPERRPRGSCCGRSLATTATPICTSAGSLLPTHVPNVSDRGAAILRLISSNKFSIAAAWGWSTSGMA